jgi:hypothetical protein
MRRKRRALGETIGTANATHKAERLLCSRGGVSCYCVAAKWLLLRSMDVSCSVVCSKIFVVCSRRGHNDDPVGTNRRGGTHNGL